MTQKEMEQLQAVLDEIERLEVKCGGKEAFFKVHDFVFESKIMEEKRSAYLRCFNALRETLSRMKVDKRKQGDEAIANEIIAYFRDGSVKLQHDLNLYAGWMEKWKGVYPNKED